MKNILTQWIPAYSQVTFSPHIRYSEALERGQNTRSHHAKHYAISKH
ncbi:MAG: hypothetical protein V9E96_21660 [Chitinophagaceae bacterium]